MTTLLFPLQTVLFPGGILPLKIFEARYLSLVSECVRYDRPFGVCLLRSAQESGAEVDCYQIGTLAKIVDWNRRPDGLLEIITEGGKKFRLLKKRERENHLLEGDVELLDDACDELPVEYQLLSDLLRRIAEQFKLSYYADGEKYEDAAWVGYRLSELLPLELEERQMLLEMNSHKHRLQQLQNAIVDFSSA